MEPVAASSAFATIVGLLSDFLARRERASAQDYQDFLDWLNEHRHGEIVRLLSEQSNTVISIKALMTQDRKDLNERLERLDRSFSAFAVTFDELKPVAEAVHPGFALSEQSLDILRQFQRSGAHKMLPTSYMDGIAVIFIGGVGGQVQITDRRFLENDLQSMVDLALLRLEYNSKGNRVYVYTRRAEDLVRLTSGD